MTGDEFDRCRTVLGIVTDKWLLLSGQEKGTATASEHLAALKARFPWLNTEEEA